MPVVRESLGEAGWPGGVVTATDPALLVPIAAPSGKNAELALGTQGIPYVQKRRGIRTLNRTPISGSPAILSQFTFTKASTATEYHLLTDSGGALRRKAADGTISTIDASAFTAGEQWPSWAVASDLCFVVNGTDRKKFDGTALSNFGITRPSVGTLAGAAGAAGTPNGTYELRVTFANSATGHESSASDTAAATVVLTSDQLDWSNIPVSGDAQVTDVYLYVRNIATQTQFYRVGSVTNGTTTATTNWVDANLTTVAPSTTSAEPPPADAKYLAFHQGRMFVATATTLWYSDLLKPEAFDADRTESFADGLPLTGIFSDREVLMIFKADHVYVLRGDDPSTWRIDLLDNATGCRSFRTIVSGDDGHTYWWSREGLARWDGLANTVDSIGSQLYGDPAARVNANELTRASAVVHHGRYLVALPGTGQTRNTFLLPFDTALSVFESELWDPMDAGSLGLASDTAGELQLYLGNMAGQVFQMLSGNNDGIAEGSVTGTFVAGGGTITTITDGTATFDTTGSGLIERKVTIVDSNGNPLTASLPRPRITSNTATAFTMHVAVGGLTAGQTYTYIVGGPDFAWDTPWRTFQTPWVKKRYEYLSLLSKGAAFGASAKINMFFDYRDTFVGQVKTFASSAGSSLWGEALWDVDVWDMATNELERFRVADVGYAWKVRIRNSEANQPFAFLALAVQAATQTVKR